MELAELQARVRELEALVESLSRRLADCSEVLGRAAERGKVCQCGMPANNSEIPNSWSKDNRKT